MMATDLYRITVNFDYGDNERNELIHKVWDNFPWMVNAYTGGYSNRIDREQDILHWCIKNIGDQASPIHNKPGEWCRGTATINGWTFIGFKSEEAMNKFIDSWPKPEGVEPQ